MAISYKQMTAVGIALLCIPLAFLGLFLSCVHTETVAEYHGFTVWAELGTICEIRADGSDLSRLPICVSIEGEPPMRLTSELFDRYSQRYVDNEMPFGFTTSNDGSEIVGFDAVKIRRRQMQIISFTYRESKQVEIMKCGRSYRFGRDRMSYSKFVSEFGPPKRTRWVQVSRGW